MKKIINKNTIFSFILGIIISGVTVYAVSNVAKDITFKANNTEWKVGNVADALDSLYISKTTDNYSTTEKVVGTWIDGKPLYQQTVITTTPNSSNGTSKPVPSNIDTLVKFEGTMKNANSDWNIFAFDYSTINIYYHNGSDELNWLNIPDHSRNKTAYLTFYYTKTTDQATNN